MGRPSKTTDEQRAAIRQQLDAGTSVLQTAWDYGISRASAIAIRDAGRSDAAGWRCTLP
jgi:hypothetical protein